MYVVLPLQVDIQLGYEMDVLQRSRRTFLSIKE